MPFLATYCWQRLHPHVRPDMQRQEDVLMRKLAGLLEGNTDCEMAHRTAEHRRNHGMCKPCH